MGNRKNHTYLTPETEVQWSLKNIKPTDLKFCINNYVLYTSECHISLYSTRTGFESVITFMGHTVFPLQELLSSTSLAASSLLPVFVLKLPVVNRVAAPLGLSAATLKIYLFLFFQSFNCLNLGQRMHRERYLARLTDRDSSQLLSLGAKQTSNKRTYGGTMTTETFHIRALYTSVPCWVPFSKKQKNPQWQILFYAK